MATTITKTIGTSSRNYSTIQSFVAAITANLVSADEVWVGECYNDSEFTATFASQISISGHTVDSAHTITLRPATGQGFKDNASVNSNALKYNQSNGVGLNSTDGYVTVLQVANDWVTIDGMQVKSNQTTSDSLTINGAVNNVVMQNCICEASGNGKVVISNYGGSSKIINCVAIQRGTGDGITMGNGGTIIGCTSIKPSDVSASGSGYSTRYSGNILKNSASFGFSVASDSSGWSTANSKNNATDKATQLPGSNNVFNVTYSSTSPFEGSTSASPDLRLKASTSLENAGLYDSTNGTVDIKGTSRSNPPDIGAWEIVSAGGGVTVKALAALGVG